MLDDRPLPNAVQSMPASDDRFIQMGGELYQSGPTPFGKFKRGCKDVWAALLFFVVTGCLVYFAAAGVKELHTMEVDRVALKDSVTRLCKMRLFLLVGSIACFLTGLVLLLMCRSCSKCVLWTSLVFTPALFLSLGVVLLLQGGLELGATSIVVGLLIVCFLYCQRSAIPTTELMLKAVGDVVKAHSGILGIAMMGGIFNFLWILLVVVAAIGALLHPSTRDAVQENEALVYGIVFVFVLTLVWGGYVCNYFVHLVHCGVFGKWYMGMDKVSPIVESLRVAGGTSFGSVCFGALIISIIRAAEAVASSARRQLRAERSDTGDIIFACIGFCIERILGLIGDIVEWISGFVFVQVAMRGFSFCEGAKVTYALAKIENMHVLVAGTLLNYVVLLTSLVCIAVGAVSGLAAAKLAQPQLDDHDDYFILLGCTLIGFWIGAAMMKTIESGGMTFVVCFAEFPDVLESASPALYHRWCGNNQANVQLSSQ